jgi:non-ribosomal peptide synthetase component E (peptide arylation enzyme)
MPTKEELLKHIKLKARVAEIKARREKEFIRMDIPVIHPLTNEVFNPAKEYTPEEMVQDNKVNFSYKKVTALTPEAAVRLIETVTGLKEFNTWLGSLGNTQRYEVIEFLDLLRISHQSSLVVGFFVNISPKNEITFDVQKLSYGSLKKIIRKEI